MKKYIKNYKTSIPGLLAFVAVGLMWKGYITAEQLTIGIATLSGLGLLGAKDANKETPQS